MSRFQPASEIQQNNALMIATWGVPKVGKTSFVLGNEALGIGHFPLPIYVFGYDQGHRELLRYVSPEVVKGTFIRRIVPTDMHESLDVVARRLSEIEQDVLEATELLRPEGRGTIFVDTASAHWNLVQAVELEGRRAKRLSDLEKKGRADDYKDLQLDFGLANTRYSKFMRVLKDACDEDGINVVLSHHAKRLYGSDGRPVTPAEWLPIEFQQTEQIVQMKIQLWRKLRAGKDSYGGYIETSRWNQAGLVGKSFESLDYPLLYELAFNEEPPK